MRGIAGLGTAVSVRLVRGRLWSGSVGQARWVPACLGGARYVSAVHGMAVTAWYRRFRCGTARCGLAVLARYSRVRQVWLRLVMVWSVSAVMSGPGGSGLGRSRRGAVRQAKEVEEN